jgi:hypothetical protein
MGRGEYIRGGTWVWGTQCYVPLVFGRAARPSYGSYCEGRKSYDVVSLWAQLLAMIGEQFEEGDEICGAVVSVRRAQDKIAIWTKTASNEAAQVGDDGHV